MKIAIIIPIFNGIAYTKKCLKSLNNQIKSVNNPAFIVEIIIVDDGSTDGSGDWIRNNYPKIHLLTGNGNLWWSGAINKAIKYGLGETEIDFFIWWNNDVVADYHYFENVLKLLRNADNRTIYGSKILLEHQPGMIWSMGGIFNTKTGFKSMIGSNLIDCDRYRNQLDCDWLTGMGTITHRTLYEEIGMLDSQNFPQYHGDADFTLRAKKSGYKIIVSPSLIIYNDTQNSGLKHSGSINRLWKSLVSIKSNYNIKKDFLFYKKHTTSVWAYIVPIKKYISYIGGFFKWKLLGLFGFQNKNMDVL